jgi:hypothetical protein
MTGRATFVFLCVRVYANGEARETIRDLEGVTSWLSYNRADRWGNALFVNGRLAHPSDRGYLSEAEIRDIESILTAEYQARASTLVPEDPAPHIEIIGGHAHRYRGYAPEELRNRFKILA